MKFNVCVLPRSVHTQCFREVAESIVWALGELGHEATYSVSDPPAFICDGKNVLLGVRPGESTLPADSIIYNGEQVNKDGMWPQLVELYKRHTVWDYSAANAKRYAEWGLPAPKIVRPGFCPFLDDGRFQEEKKTHDVVFFGSPNERREKVLQAIEAQGFSVLRVPFGVYGAERDALIAKAKICVNIHYYESAIFESVRCSYLAQCGVPVISESSVAGENSQWGISGISYNSLAAFVCSALGGDLAAYGKSLAVSAKKVSILDDVRAALAGNEEPGAVIVVPSNEPKRASVPITLCMIVKDEKDVIERCLASVKPFITRWCIVDTGSTDGTQDIIRKFMADTPGQLHECAWKEFDGSRSEAIDLARAECQNEGWLMMLDADEYLLLEGDLEIPDGHDCHNAWFTFGNETRWARPMFVRADKPWFFEMPRHEGLYCRTHAPAAPNPIHSLLVMSTREGARAKEGERERFERDAKVLEAWFLKHPDHARCAFYIAQSYDCAASATSPPDRGLSQKAITWYLKRAEMPRSGHPQETFSARYLAGQIMMRLGYPWERIQHTFLQAYAIGTSRAEPLYNIARYYREQGDQERLAGRPAAGQYALAEMFARKAAQIGPSEHVTANVDHSVNDWRAMDELATALTFLNGHAEARDLFRRILRLAPPWERARIEANLEMCRRLAPDPA